MPCLLDQIRSRARNETLVATNDREFSVSDILDLVRKIRFHRANHAGNRVVLEVASPFEDLLQLIAMDGFARELLLFQMQGEGFERRDREVEITNSDSLFEISSETIWVLASSGTTGPPKLVRHSPSTLCRSIRPTPNTRWLLTYPVFRMAGLLVTLQALLGQGVLCVPSATTFEDVVKTARLTHAQSVSATPSWWRRLLGSGLSAGLQPENITLGGEIANQATLDALARQFPKARVRHIYASTEIGMGFTVRDGLEGFPASWIESPPPGILLRVLGDELHVGRALRRDSGITWLPTGDLVSFDPLELRYRFLGRASGTINVGGEKVHPETIESILVGIYGIKECLVYGRPNSILGNLVVADIVTDRPRCEIEPEIKDHCRRHLQRWQIPAIFRFVDHLELTSTGKRRREVE